MFFICNKSKTVLLSILILTLSTISTLAQEESSPKEVVPYYPGNKNLATQEKEIAEIRKGMEERLFSNWEELLAARAFRKNNREICSQLNSAEGIQHCQERVDSFIFLESLAKGRCNKLDKLPGFRGFVGSVGSKKVCQALRKKNCSSLKGYQRMLCEAFLKRDKELCREAINTPEFIAQNGQPDNDIHEKAINLYYGFKTGNERVCDRFSLKGSFINKLICHFLFSRNLEVFQEQLIEDLTYFVYVKEMKNDEKFCEDIRDPFIRKKCYDTEIVELRDLLSQ